MSNSSLHQNCEKPNRINYQLVGSICQNQSRNICFQKDHNKKKIKINKFNIYKLLLTTVLMRWNMQESGIHLFLSYSNQLNGSQHVTLKPFVNWIPRGRVYKLMMRHDLAIAGQSLELNCHNLSTLIVLLSFQVGFLWKFWFKYSDFLCSQNFSFLALHTFSINNT